MVLLWFKGGLLPVLDARLDTTRLPLDEPPFHANGRIFGHLLAAAALVSPVLRSASHLFSKRFSMTHPTALTHLLLSVLFRSDQNDDVSAIEQADELPSRGLALRPKRPPVARPDAIIKVVRQE
jgi:hypothetical protein